LLFDWRPEGKGRDQQAQIKGCFAGVEKVHDIASSRETRQNHKLDRSAAIG
jgi:hypothetical protein